MCSRAADDDEAGWLADWLFGVINSRGGDGDGGDAAPNDHRAGIKQTGGAAASRLPFMPCELNSV